MTKFDKLAYRIAREYRKKGYSAADALRIGKATAAKVHREQAGGH